MSAPATFEDILADSGKLVYKTRGVSMEPMLRQDRDLVVIVPPAGRLRRLDVALYRRGKSYVLHRVVGVEPWGYLIRGDNTETLERVPEEAVIGVLSAFHRKGRSHTVRDPGYRCYAFLWTGLYPVRHFARRVRRALGWRARKLRRILTGGKGDHPDARP